MSKCIRTIALNFDKNPNIDGMPEKLLPKLVDQLSLTLPVNIFAAFLSTRVLLETVLYRGETLEKLPNSGTWLDVETNIF